ncbi:hypothetical protein GCM10009779_14290 [Polymorphospora rubra]|uniref:Uncharacterized protein n=1 Tax=Polymorphospora rubra TaxID=338584 RepID=A0A810MV16_9ACTN|nr:hypothetical protein Prubr_14010 [Polymorphospora rubra]
MRTRSRANWPAAKTPATIPDRSSRSDGSAGLPPAKMGPSTTAVIASVSNAPVNGTILRRPDGADGRAGHAGPEVTDRLRVPVAGTAGPPPLRTTIARRI